MSVTHKKTCDCYACGLEAIRPENCKKPAIQEFVSEVKKLLGAFDADHDYHVPECNIIKLKAMINKLESYEH